MEEAGAETGETSLGAHIAGECVGGLFEFAFENLGLWVFPLALLAFFLVLIVAAISAGFDDSYGSFDRWPTSILGLNDERK